MKKVVNDILWHNSLTNETQIWFMDNHKVASRATVIGEDGKPAFVGLPWSIVGTNDFNRNGTADILWHNSSDGAAQIWFMDGNRTVSRANVVGEDSKPMVIGPPWSIVGIGDFNRNGTADILFHSNDGTAQIWFMDNHKIVSRATVIGENGKPASAGPPFSIVGVNDMNGDGKSDIIWHNSSTGKIQIWFMDGHRVVSQATVVGEKGQEAAVGSPWSIVGIGEFNPLREEPPVVQPHLPETVTLDSGSITSGLPIGGFAKLVMSRGGQFTFSGHLHDSGALGIDYLLTLVAMTPSGIAYTMQRQGHTAGTFTPGSRNDDWTISGFNVDIRGNWAEASQSRLTWTLHANDTLTPQLGKALEEALQEALKAAGKAAVQAVISLL